MTALVVTPHPLSTQGQQVLDAQAAALVPGETLAVFLQRHGVVAGQQWVVSLGGVEVPEAHWLRLRPKHGHLIEARRVPQKQVLQLVAIAALAYLTFGAGGIAGGSFLGMGTSVAAYIAAGVVFMAGSMVINKLLGPKVLTQATNSQNPSYSLTGGRNTARLFEPMGLVLGQPYCVPDLAAQNYTYFANGEQFLWQLFHAGLNCASVDTLRIGQTAMSAYQGVTLSYDGFASGNTGLPVLTSSVDTVPGALLDAPTSPGAWTTRTTSVNTIQLVVDLEGQLYKVSGNGAYENLLCILEVEFRAVGSSTWELLHSEPYDVVTPPVYSQFGLGGEQEHRLISPGYTTTITPTNVRLNNANSKPLRLSLQRSVPAGQYEVRARKVTANETATNAQNTIQWTVLKSYQLDTGNYAGQARLGVQIQATGQLSGSLDEVNWMATAKPHPYWNGSSWTTATTRSNGLSNPGALLLLLARGIYGPDGRLLAGLGFADSQIDIAGLQGFMQRCAAKGFTFDYFVQESTSIGDLLNAIAAAGMGTVSWHTGKLGAVWFSEDDPVESVLNMGTMKAKSFSVDYDTGATADEMEYQYFDRNRGNAWKSVRVLAPGITTPTDTARQKLVGVTSEAHAAILARFSMAQNIYLRKTVNCEVDLEHMTFRRGTVMAVSHDVTQWGYGGRLRAASNAGGTVTLKLDDVVPAVSPSGATSRYVGLRLAGERQYRVFPIAAFTGSSRVLTLATAWPGGVPVPGDSASNPAWDAVWIYDFKATPGQKMRVADISPQGNMDGARVALVPESPEFWTYVWTGAYTPPPNTSLLQGGPVVSRVLVTEQLKRQGTTYYTELTLTFDVTGSYAQAELWGAIGDGPKALLSTTRGTRLTWQGGLDETWYLELRPFSDLHTGTPYATGYKVGGLSVPPEPFDFFTILVQPDGTRQYNFGYNSLDAQPADWLGCEIRYTSGTVPTPDWASMQLLQDTTTYYTHSPVELNAPLSGTYTFAAKSLDTTGNESSMLVRTIALPDRRLGNVFDEFFEEQEGWLGTKTGCQVQGGILEALDSTTWATLPSTWAGWTRWNLNPTTPITYTTPVRDFGTVVAGQVNSTIDADGTLVQEMRVSADGSTWGAWGSSVAPFSTRYLQLRITVAATTPSPVPTVRSWRYQINAPIKSEYINDVQLATLGSLYRLGVGDVRIPLGGSYSILKRTTIVVQDNRSGTWTYVRIDQTLSPGPRWQFRLNGTLTDPQYVDFFVEGY
nr:host specificity factor TipJ family phage tail protein [uncultured Albidiferax sp.]